MCVCFLNSEGYQFAHVYPIRKHQTYVSEILSNRSHCLHHFLSVVTGHRRSQWSITHLGVCLRSLRQKCQQGWGFQLHCKSHALQFSCHRRRQEISLWDLSPLWFAHPSKGITSWYHLGWGKSLIPVGQWILSSPLVKELKDRKNSLGQDKSEIYWESSPRNREPSDSRGVVF